MKVGILTNTPRSYTANRFREAGKARGMTIRILETSSFALHIEQGSPELIYKGKPLKKIDALVPRVSAGHSFFAHAVVRQFEQRGVFCLNPSHAISVAGDKLRTMQVMSRHRVKIPPTAFVFGKADIEPAIERLGNPPVIVKLLSGSQGSGVILCETKKVASATVEALQAAKQNILIQKFVAESKGRDIRAFVVGGRVVAAMRRIAAEGEYRSNVHLGAFTEPVTLDENYERTAILAAEILGLRVAGVDLLESSEGPQVMEVNASPGLEGIETASKLDIAGTILDYLADQVLFPDLDVRRRLSLEKGYRIVEIPVLRKSPLAGKSIQEAGLPELEVQVLSITRGSITLPTPKLVETILPGDTLLCFGKELVLRNLIPAKLQMKGRKSGSASFETSSDAGGADGREPEEPPGELPLNS